VGKNQQEKKHRIWQGLYIYEVDRTQENVCNRKKRLYTW